MLNKIEKEDSELSLSLERSNSISPMKNSQEKDQNQSLPRRFLVESKKLWEIVGPAIISRIASYAMLIITQAFAGHIGNLELAAVSIATTIIVDFNIGLMIGMASALETLCGQAFGAKKYHMLGVYLQRSWIILFCCCVLTLPLYIFATPILKLLGQPPDVAELSGFVSLCLIPVHFCFAFQFPLQRFLQSQLKNNVNAVVNVVTLAVHVLFCWVAYSKLHLGLVGVLVSLNFSWWLIVFLLLGYTVFGGCPLTWTGFSFDAFRGLWEFLKLSASSGVMICLESWYYSLLLVMTGKLDNAKIAVDALSICMNINFLEMMIPLSFFAGLGVRVANEMGAGNGKAAKFATIVSLSQSIVIGFFLLLLILFCHNKLALIWTTNETVLQAVHKLSILLAFTILLNSVQPILSGVAVGSGWQAYVAYINLGCYYLLGLPLGLVLRWAFHLGIMGIWAGMACGGVLIQTVILSIIIIRCDWEKEAEKATLHVKKWDQIGVA